MTEPSVRPEEPAPEGGILPAADSSPGSGSLVIQGVLRTDVGLVRSENQDFGVLSTPEEAQAEGGARLMMVADGLGGHRGGATASRLAANTVRHDFLDQAAGAGDLAETLRAAFQHANATVFAQAQQNPELRGMGTTGSALVIRDGHAHFAHVGDSRIYLVRDDTIKQLTQDHSLVASMVREGLLTPSEAENHPRRNVLQRCIGVSDQVEIDVSGSFAVRNGDTFILCSDGLHGLVKEDELRQIARLPIEQAADQYVRMALDRGAPDNVTVIVARVTADAAAETVGEPESQRKAGSPTLGPPTLESETLRTLSDESAQTSGDENDDTPRKPHQALPTVPPPSASPAAATKPVTGTRSLMKWLVITAIVLAAAVAALYTSRKPAEASTGTAAPAQTNT